METTEIIIISIASIACIFSIVSLGIAIKIYKKYEKNMDKLGEGKDFAQMLSAYVSQVDALNKRDDQIIELCNTLNMELSQCIKKVGLYKYDAFGNTRNELSFSLALLDRENNGIVINSIYGQDSSNIYSKPIIKGESQYKLSDEEREAINKAISR